MAFEPTPQSFYCAILKSRAKSPMHTRQIGKTNSFGLDQRTPVNLAKLEDFFSLQLVLVLNLGCWCPEMCCFHGTKNELFPLILYFPSGPPFSRLFWVTGCLLYRGFQGTAYVQIHFSFSFWFSAWSCGMLICHRVVYKFPYQPVQRLLAGSGSISKPVHWFFACFLTKLGCW